MKMKTLFSALAITAAGLATAVSAQAASTKPVVTMDVTPRISSPMNIMLVQPADKANSYTYTYALTDGEEVTDEIPVTMCLTGSTNTWDHFYVNFSKANGSASGITVPSDTLFSFSEFVADQPTCKTGTIRIASGQLKLTDPTVGETLAANINISPKDGDPSTLSFSTASNFPDIHIRYEVKPALNDTTCFTTDSEGNLLAKCDGTAVTASGSYDGRFAINTNKKNIEVSTNPGQFYYNILWTNMTGEDQTVDVSFAASNVSAKGANAIHAYVLPPSFSGVTPENFQLVNDAIPGGSDGSIENVNVPAGWTLWANYHLSWSGIGAPAPGDIAPTCGVANQEMAVIGTVAEVGGAVHTCGSGASGYKK